MHLLMSSQLSDDNNFSTNSRSREYCIIGCLLYHNFYQISLIISIPFFMHFYQIRYMPKRTDSRIKSASTILFIEVIGKRYSKTYVNDYFSVVQWFSCRLNRKQSNINEDFYKRKCKKKLV